MGLQGENCSSPNFDLLLVKAWLAISIAMHVLVDQGVNFQYAIDLFFSVQAANQFHWGGNAKGNFQHAQELNII